MPKLMKNNIEYKPLVPQTDSTTGEDKDEDEEEDTFDRVFFKPKNRLNVLDGVMRKSIALAIISLTVFLTISLIAYFLLVRPPLCPAVPPNLVGPITPRTEAPSMDELIRKYKEVKVGGHGQPNSCTARHRVAIIIPYRFIGSHPNGYTLSFSQRP